MNAEVLNTIMDTISELDSAEVIETLVAVVASRFVDKTINEDGSETLNSIDMDSIKAIYDEVGNLKKALKKTSDDMTKAAKKEAKEVAESEAREFVLDAVSEGDTVSWYFAKQKRVVTGKVAKQKDGAKRLHVILDEAYADGEAKLDKYVEFAKIYSATDWDNFGEEVA